MHDFTLNAKNEPSSRRILTDASVTWRFAELRAQKSVAFRPLPTDDLDIDSTATRATRATCATRATRATSASAPAAR